MLYVVEVIYEEMCIGIVWCVKCKCLGIFGVCVLIQNKYNIDVVLYVFCQGFSWEEIEDFLIEFCYFGIDNVLVICGDDLGYIKFFGDGCSVNVYVCDLVQQISDMNGGDYFDDLLLNIDLMNFCVGVVGYFEKYFEVLNIDFDVCYVKVKVDVGVEYIVIQMFFDNVDYFDYVDCCCVVGIDVLIIFGFKILMFKKYLMLLLCVFLINILSVFLDEVEKVDLKQVVDVGVEWVLVQMKELMDCGVLSVYFYIMLSMQVIKWLMKQLFC